MDYNFLTTAFGSAFAALKLQRSNDTVNILNSDPLQETMRRTFCCWKGKLGKSQVPVFIFPLLALLGILLYCHHRLLTLERQQSLLRKCNKSKYLLVNNANYI